MLTIEVIAVGKIKEKYLKDAISEYSKRLSRYCSFKITEVPDSIDDEQAIYKEGAIILSRIKGIVVPLCVEGSQKSSENFADFIEKCAVDGNSHITFIIGGSRGLDEQIKKMGKIKLSFSNMTFPHQLMRVILLEQIYRASKINSGESYHK